MDRQLKQMVRLVDDLLDVSRISRGKVEIRKERVQLRPVLEQAVETVNPTYAAAQQELRLEFPQEEVWIEVDPTRLSQMVSNLLNNATRYSGRGSQVELRSVVRDDEIIVTVKDQGNGIPPEKLGAIFEMFSQVDRSLERTSGGLGIGLYLVKRLAELHGGSDSAHSDGIGKGSEFVLRLPVVVESPNDAERNLSSKPKATTSLRVLVVDDNEDAAKTMSMLLRALHYETQVAHDGIEALESVERFSPNAILLDIGLPWLNGYEVCERIRSQPDGDKILIIALTGWGQEQDKLRAEESGFDAHCVKPIEADVLIRLLETRGGESKLSHAASV